MDNDNNNSPEEQGENNANTVGSGTMAEETTPGAMEEQAETVETEPPSEGTLLYDLMELTRLKTSDETYAIAKMGVEEFLAEILKPQYREQRVDNSIAEAMIDELDARLSRQMDEILHHPDFQVLESAWRGLHLLVENTDFKENIKMRLLNVSKEDLAEDFDDAPDIAKSGLYKHVYSEEYGQLGGEPYGAMVAAYDFTPRSPDLNLLQHAASLSAMAHTPFLGGAGPEFLSIESYDELPGVKDLEAIFESPQYAKWQAFRDADDARNVGLALPRFLLRLPYGGDNPVKSFRYGEDTGGEKGNYLWGNAAFALASRLTDSFAKYRWCPNIIGPRSGGTVYDLPIHVFEQDGDLVGIGPTESVLSDRMEFELAELGFIPLTMRKGGNNAVFFSANSPQRPKAFGSEPEGRQAALDFKLGTQLPYLFIVTRLAHYIKVMQRENLGSWKSANDLDRELNRWISQYVSNQENPGPGVRSRRPLRWAEIAVADAGDDAGWYNVEIKVTPHIKFMGANFTLTLIGKLDMV